MLNPENNMQQEIIEKNGVLIAKIIRDRDWPEGIQFYSDETEFLQVATWNYNKEKHLKAHGHRIAPRSSDRTNEVLFVKKGEIEAIFYDEQDNVCAKSVIKSGDIVIILAGGHAYNILAEGTQVLEVKNGPYQGLEKDKKVIEV